MKKFALLFFVLAGTAFAVKEGFTDKVAGSFPQWFQKGIYVSSVLNNAPSTTANKVTGIFHASATIDFASTTVGSLDHSGTTITGVAVGDSCFVGAPGTPASNATFSCYVSAANTVKVRFTPTAANVGAITMSTGTGTATVLASSVCVCSEVTDATRTVGCALSSTTLTATGTASDVINYSCRSPVDPASASYNITVMSHQ